MSPCAKSRSSPSLPAARHRSPAGPAIHVLSERGSTMNATDLLEKRLHAMSNTQVYRLDRPAEPPAPPAVLSVALEREAGTPGASVAHEVAGLLGWDVYDHELLERMARDMGLRVSLLESLDERRQHWLRLWMETWSQGPLLSESWYTRELVETVLRLGAKGRCIIVGRGAAQILPADSTLRVRLVAPREERIAMMARRLNLGHDEAARQVANTDRERLGFVQDHFHKNAGDPALYDLVLNAARWSVAECAAMVVAAVRRLESRLA